MSEQETPTAEDGRGIALSVPDAISAAWLQGRKAGLEEAAKVADTYADTKPDYARSDNKEAAMFLAAGMSEGGAKIAADIRSLMETTP